MKKPKHTKEAAKLIHEYKSLQDALKAEKRELRLSIRNLKDYQRVSEIFQLAAKKVQDRVHTQLSRIVTKCLRAVFSDPYEFKIIFERKRNKTEARVAFCRDGMELGAKDQIGGSVMEVAAFALRLGCLMIQRPHRRRLVVMDEPFLTVGERKDNRVRVRALLESLSEELDVQFVIATNDPDLEVGKVVDLDKKGK